MGTNYTDNGGRVFVVGGELKILPGAKVTGLELAGAGAKLPFIPDSKATTVAALREEFNGLLAALREAGLMAGEDA